MAFDITPEYFQSNVADATLRLASMSSIGGSSWTKNAYSWTGNSVTGTYGTGRGTTVTGYLCRVRPNGVDEPIALSSSMTMVPEASLRFYCTDTAGIVEDDVLVNDSDTRISVTIQSVQRWPGFCICLAEERKTAI